MKNIVRTFAFLLAFVMNMPVMAMQNRKINKSPWGIVDPVNLKEIDANAYLKRIKVILNSLQGGQTLTDSEFNELCKEAMSKIDSYWYANPSDAPHYWQNLAKIMAGRQPQVSAMAHHHSALSQTTPRVPSVQTRSLRLSGNHNVLSPIVSREEQSNRQANQPVVQSPVIVRDNPNVNASTRNPNHRFNPDPIVPVPVVTSQQGVNRVVQSQQQRPGPVVQNNNYVVRDAAVLAGGILITALFYHYINQPNVFGAMGSGPVVPVPVAYQAPSDGNNQQVSVVEPSVPVHCGRGDEGVIDLQGVQSNAIESNDLVTTNSTHAQEQPRVRVASPVIPSTVTTQDSVVVSHNHVLANPGNAIVINNDLDEEEPLTNNHHRSEDNRRAIVVASNNVPAGEAVEIPCMPMAGSNEDGSAQSLQALLTTLHNYRSGMGFSLNAIEPLLMSAAACHNRIAGHHQPHISGEHVNYEITQFNLNYYRQQYDNLLVHINAVTAIMNQFNQGQHQNHAALVAKIKTEAVRLLRLLTARDNNMMQLFVNCARSEGMYHASERFAIRQSIHDMSKKIKVLNRTLLQAHLLSKEEQADFVKRLNSMTQLIT